jgi:hypothetical protein
MISTTTGSLLLESGTVPIAEGSPPKANSRHRRGFKGVECEAPGAFGPGPIPPPRAVDISRKIVRWSLGLHKVFLKLL